MAAPPDVDTELFGSLFLLAQHLTRRADAQIEHLGITSRQWLLLAVVDTAFADAPPTLTQAAAGYGTSRQNVKQIALQLQDKGWLRLERDPDDGRATRIVLTDKVDAFRDPGFQSDAEAFLDHLFGALSSRERRTLRDLVVRCVDHLAADDPHAPGNLHDPHEPHDRKDAS